MPNLTYLSIARREAQMSNSQQTVLVVGATGSVGRLVPAIADEHGLHVRALVRNTARAAAILPGTELARGDLENVDSLREAVKDVDAIILAQGSSADGSPERIDYRGTRNLLIALGDARPRLVVMTALYVTRRDHFLNRDFDGVLDWRRRAERLVRASGLPYTIVRPGWFDRIEQGDDRLVFEQGDTADAGVGRRQIAEVLVQSLLHDAALGKTFELTAAKGAAPTDWAGEFAALRQDAAGALDGPFDRDSMPLHEEPDEIRAELEALRRAAH
jgi:uncharacterized protein YbjT (DUF2867 family)